MVDVDVGVVPEDAGDGFSTLRCPSGAREVVGDVAAVIAAMQTDAGPQEDVVAVAAAAAVVAATAAACLDEDVGDECDEQPDAKSAATRR